VRRVVKVVVGALALMGAILIAPVLMPDSKASATTGDIVPANIYRQVYTGSLPNGTDTYASFKCPMTDGVDSRRDILVDAVASRQVGSGPAVALEILDYVADTYQDGVIVALRNSTGTNSYYRVSLLCGVPTALP